MYLTIRGGRDWDDILICSLRACAVTSVEVHFRYRGSSYRCVFVGAHGLDPCVEVYKGSIRDMRFSVDWDGQLEPRFSPSARF